MVHCFYSLFSPFLEQACSELGHFEIKESVRKEGDTMQQKEEMVPLFLLVLFSPS